MWIFVWLFAVTSKTLYMPYWKNYTGAILSPCAYLHLVLDPSSQLVSQRAQFEVIPMCTLILQNSVFNSSWATAFQGTGLRAQEREALCHSTADSGPSLLLKQKLSADPHPCSSTPSIPHVSGLQQEALLECSRKLWRRHHWTLC